MSAYFFLLFFPKDSGNVDIFTVMILHDKWYELKEAAYRFDVIVFARQIIADVTKNVLLPSCRVWESFS